MPKTRKIFYLFIFILIVLVILLIKIYPLVKKKDVGSAVPIAQEQDLAPEGFAWDGENFWTAHEPGWEVDDEIKPGHEDFQAYILKHANDDDKTAVKMYTVPHHYNVIGMTFINGDLWTSSWINSNLGRIYHFRIEDNKLVESGSWDTEISCDGLAWDGSYLWCNMGGEIGLVKFDINSGLEEIRRYGVPNGLEALEGEISPKGLAWDGAYLWSAYKHTDPVIIKHRMDEELSILAGYQYDNELLNFHPGDLAFKDGVLYTSSSDPGTGDMRGGRIVKHKMDDQLSIDQIFFYNSWK